MANNTPSPQALTPIVIIGIGNEFRGDDGAGLAVAEILKAENLAGVEVKIESGEGAILLESWQNFKTAIIVDAARGGGPPGTIHRFEIQDKPLPRSIFNSCSSHAFSVVEAIEMGKTLDRLPPNLIVYGIEGKSFGMGLGLSDEVQKAVVILAKRIATEISVV
jgi:hydrogenase maturation protease